VDAGRFALARRTPGLIWVHGIDAGDVMVDRSIRRERLRPLKLSWVAACRREPIAMREQAGRVEAIGALVGWLQASMLVSLSR
jgi:hypothetical protein